MLSSATTIAAVLFDMDGVLIDSNAVIERAWTEAANMYGKSLSENDIIRHIHGQPGPHTIHALFSELQLEDQQKVQAHIMQVENTADYVPIPGVALLIQALYRSGISVGVVTSGWREKINRVLEMLQVTHCISVIVERNDVARGKPYPDPYLLAAKRLSLPPCRTIVFEDSQSGVSSAVAAGCVCIGIGDENLKEWGASMTIPDFRCVQVKSQTATQVTISFPQRQVLAMEPQVRE